MGEKECAGTSGSGGAVRGAEGEFTKEGKMADVETVPSYGLLVINHAYNQGKLIFKEWLELSREWAVKFKEQYKGKAE